MARVTHLNINHRGADGAVFNADDLEYDNGASGLTATDVQAAIDEVVSTGGVTEILDIPTAETDDTLVLAPDGVGGVEFRAETGASLPWITDNVQPDAYPGSPTAFDDEFADGSIDAKWTITNDPGLDEIAFPGFLTGLFSELGTDNFDNLVRIHQTPPTGTALMQFAAKVCITATGSAAEFGEFATVGVYLGNSTNDELVAASVQLSNDTAGTTLLRLRGEQYTAGTSAAFTTDQVQVMGSAGQYIYLMLYKQGSAAYTSANTYVAWVSMNGLLWQEVGTMSKTFTTACDEVGIYWRRPKSQTGSPSMRSNVDWFRKLF